MIYPGFAGGDRTEIALPKTQQKLLEDLHKTGKPVVLVLMTGSALAVEWAKANLPAVLVAWYPPAGRQRHRRRPVRQGQPVRPPAGTFYQSVDDLPPFADYSMKNRTYSYFTGEPLYAFGHGLSYTRFDYTGMRIAPTSAAQPRRPTPSTCRSTCRTPARGRARSAAALRQALDATRLMPLRELRGFTRIHLAPGARQRVSFRVTKQDLAYYDEAAKRFVTAPGEYEIAAARAPTSRVRPCPRAPELPMLLPVFLPMVCSRPIETVQDLRCHD